MIKLNHPLGRKSSTTDSRTPSIERRGDINCDGCDTGSSPRKYRLRWCGNPTTVEPRFVGLIGQAEPNRKIDGAVVKWKRDPSPRATDRHCVRSSPSFDRPSRVHRSADCRGVGSSPFDRPSAVDRRRSSICQAAFKRARRLRLFSVLWKNMSSGKPAHKRLVSFAFELAMLRTLFWSGTDRIPVQPTPQNISVSVYLSLRQVAIPFVPTR